uniref:Uncharacterized protein n=1 Tax=Mesocestoides corti TaxID=53468 RepID=A0A5K3FB53_MESCO
MYKYAIDPSRVKTQQEMAASLAVTLALLVACLIGLGDGLTLREAQSDPQYYILYNQEPFNVGKQAGVASVVVFGTLTTVLASFAIIVRMFVRMGRVRPRKRD